MNYKLEKFWNNETLNKSANFFNMNYKLEKFWNYKNNSLISCSDKWTINLKSFEIRLIDLNAAEFVKWTINLKSFEILMEF